MPDMLVNLLKLPEERTLLDKLEAEGYRVHRALAPDKGRVLDWVAEHSSPAAASECDVCFSRLPVSCFIVRRGPAILGYACYNAIAPDYFGPTRVLDSEQGRGLGKALLLRSLHALREEGYIYAIIGGVGPADFYTKCVGASLIPDSTPGIYEDYLGRVERESR
ncbi:N-acetyltransferase [Treponema sp.]